MRFEEVDDIAPGIVSPHDEKVGVHWLRLTPLLVGHAQGPVLAVIVSEPAHNFRALQFSTNDGVFPGVEPSGIPAIIPDVEVAAVFLFALAHADDDLVGQRKVESLRLFGDSTYMVELFLLGGSKLFDRRTMLGEQLVDTLLTGTF